MTNRWGAPLRALALLALCFAGACTSTASSAPAPDESIGRTTEPTTALAGTTTTTPSSSSTPSASSTSASTTSTSSSTTSSSTTTTLPATPFDAGEAQAFDDVVAAATVGRGDLAASVAIVRDGKVLHAAAFGMENVWTQTGATPETNFRLASVSKVLTATVLLQLVDEGAIQLDGPFVAQLGGDAPGDPRWMSVTVADLLSQTAGVGKHGGLFFDEGAASWADAGGEVLERSLSGDPRSSFQYSNANFVLLGLLIEHVTGQAYETAVSERLAGPLGDPGMRLAGTYDDLPGQALYPANPDRNFMEVLGPAGGWVATPTAIAQLLDSLDPDPPAASWQPLPTALSDLMRTPQPTPPPSPTWNYGHGLMLFPDGTWGHTGTVEQTHSIVVHRPDDLTIALFVDGESPRNTDRLLTIVDDALRAAGR